MKQTETITKISASLLEAQKKIGGVAKDGKNPFFKSDYATLSACIDAIKTSLNDAGLTILQPIGDNKVYTRILHSSGEWLEDEGTPIICAKVNDPQAQGSAITYARRYGLMSFLSLKSEDDDGEKATIHKVTNSTTNDVIREPIDNRMEFKDSQCKDCGGDIIISQSTGKPFCKNKCWLPENLHFRNGYKKT